MPGEFSIEGAEQIKQRRILGAAKIAVGAVVIGVDVAFNHGMVSDFLIAGGVVAVGLGADNLSPRKTA